MLNQIEYPIVGQFRGVLLVIEWLIIILSLQLGILFLGKYVRKRRENSFRDLSFSILFIGIAVSEFFNYLADFYTTLNHNPFFGFTQIGTQRMVFIYLSELILMSGGLVFVIIMEKHKKYLLLRFFFSYSLATLLIIWVFSAFFNIYVIRYFTHLYLGLYMLFIALYLNELFNVIGPYEKMIKNIIKYSPPFVLILIGFILSNEEVMLIFGLEMRVLGGLIQIFGLSFFLYRFNRLPAFSEFNVGEKIEQLYLISQSGVCLFNKVFTSESDISKRHLISSAISSINVILNDLIGEHKEKGQSTIKKDGKIIFIFPGENVFGVIISNEEIPFIERFLESFVMRFENIYSGVLDNWNGDVNLFIPVDSLAQEIFGLKE